MITDFWFKFKQFIRQSFCHHEYIYKFIPFKFVWICQKCGHEAKRKPADKLIADKNFKPVEIDGFRK